MSSRNCSTPTATRAAELSSRPWMRRQGWRNRARFQRHQSAGMCRHHQGPSVAAGIVTRIFSGGLQTPPRPAGLIGSSTVTYESVLVSGEDNSRRATSGRDRYDHINAFEQTAREEGTTILKFFPAHLFLRSRSAGWSRGLTESLKNWKFSP